MKRGLLRIDHELGHELQDPLPLDAGTPGRERLLAVPTWEACRLPHEPRQDPKYPRREAEGQKALDLRPDDGQLSLL